jgi:hypothetical protein
MNGQMYVYVCVCGEAGWVDWFNQVQSGSISEDIVQLPS